MSKLNFILNFPSHFKMCNIKPVAVATQFQDYKNNIIWKYEMRLLSEAMLRVNIDDDYETFYSLFLLWFFSPSSCSAQHRWYTVKLNVMFFFLVHFSTGFFFPQKTVPKLTLIGSILCSVASPTILLLFSSMFQTFFHTSICVMTTIEEHDRTWRRVGNLISF